MRCVRVRVSVSASVSVSMFEIAILCHVISVFSVWLLARVCLDTRERLGSPCMLIQQFTFDLRFNQRLDNVSIAEWLAASTLIWSHFNQRFGRIVAVVPGIGMPPLLNQRDSMVNIFRVCVGFVIFITSSVLVVV